MAPDAPHAQRKPMPVIGYLSSNSPSPSAPLLAAFRQGLSEVGYVEGQNLVIEYRWAEALYDRLPALVADLVGRKVDVIAATGGSARAAKNATSTIPIVFTGSGDPVGDGLIATLSRPGGNVTGITFMTPELTPKWVELLSEMAPQSGVIALLVNPNDARSAERTIREVQQTADAKGRQLQILKAGTESEIDAAFTTFAHLQIGALVIGGDTFFSSQGDRLAALSVRHAIAAIYEWREFATAGGLISYGPSVTGTHRRAGVYAGKILNGAKPADLPVEQPTRFELVVNLKTAKALGLTVPPSILARADEVIE
jgi:putative ABC transport system substrate-binding protein